MTKEEYEQRKKDLQAKHKKELEALATAYVLTHPSCRKVGDVVEDDVGIIIKVERILTYMNIYGVPEPVYHGTVLRKDRVTPRKSGMKTLVYHGRLRDGTK